MSQSKISRPLVNFERRESQACSHDCPEQSVGLLPNSALKHSEISVHNPRAIPQRHASQSLLKWKDKERDMKHGEGPCRIMVWGSWFLQRTDWDLGCELSPSVVCRSPGASSKSEVKIEIRLRVFGVNIEARPGIFLGLLFLLHSCLRLRVSKAITTKPEPVNLANLFILDLLFSDVSPKSPQSRQFSL